MPTRSGLASKQRQCKTVSQKGNQNIFINESRFGPLREGEGRNQFLVSIVTRYQLQDHHLKYAMLILLLPIQLLVLLFASYNYGSISKVYYACFGYLEKAAGIKRSQVVKIKKLKKEMTLVAISDSHNLHEKLVSLPKGDVLIHTGDCSNFGTFSEIKNFAEWFAALPGYTYKIFVPGNHDVLMDGEFYDVYYNEWSYTGKKESTQKIYNLMSKLGIIVLVDHSVTINNLKFYGSPWTLQGNPWQTGFQLQENTIGEKWKMIDKSTDILLTHSPPFGIGDRTVYGGEKTGCKKLRETIFDTVTPLIHIFGHGKACVTSFYVVINVVTNPFYSYMSRARRDWYFFIFCK